MAFLTKLPQNRKEFIVFIAVVSIISVNIIAPLITCFEIGFSFQVWANTLKVIPFIWLSVIAIVLLTAKPAEWLTSKLVMKGDSFNSHIIINILCTVFLMSILLTIVGTWIGSKQFNIEPILTFFYKWPSNFTISFFVEACIAQPIAHQVMRRMHQNSSLNLAKNC